MKERIFGLGNILTMVKVLNYGFKKDFYDYFKVEDVLKYNRINKEDIIIDIKKLL